MPPCLRQPFSVLYIAKADFQGTPKKGLAVVLQASAPAAATIAATSSGEWVEGCCRRMSLLLMVTPCSGVVMGARTSAIAAFVGA